MDDTGEKECEIQTREFEKNDPNFGSSSWEKVIDAATRGRYEELLTTKKNYEFNESLQRDNRPTFRSIWCQTRLQNL
jgi:hypothetical protein